MNDFRPGEFIIEEEEEPENLGTPCTRSFRQRIPPGLETALDMKDRPSTTVELYTEQRRVQGAKLSPTYQVTVMRIRPSNQSAPPIDPKARIYSERLDGFNPDTLRARLIETLRNLSYKEETPIGAGWEYTFSYVKRKEVRAQLKEQIELIR